MVPASSTRIVTGAATLSVPACTMSPAVAATGRDSPVSSAALTLVLPSMTVPSAGKLSPARTRNSMPGSSAEAGSIRSSPLGSSTRAESGASE